MSWSDSLLSPSDGFHETNSYTQNSTQTNIVPAPLEPNEGPYPFTFEQLYATRLSSPRIYTLFPTSTSGVPLHPPQSLRPVPDRNFDNTLRDVQSALHNADMALRNAQAAFRHGRSTRSNTSNIVDLTGSDDVNEAAETIDIQGSRNVEPHTQSQPPIQAPVMRMSAPSTGGFMTSGRLSRIQARQRREQRLETSSSDWDEGEDEDEDEQEEEQPGSNSDVQVRVGRPLRQIVPHLHGSQGSLSQQSVQAEQSAVRRQRQARRDWERVERRNRERAQQQAQTDAQNDSQRSSNNEGQTSTRRSIQRLNSNESISEISVPSIDLTQNTKDEDASEPVDLTGADDDKTLKNILAKEQQDAIAAQIKPPSTDNTASALSNYKCAICMDSPKNATTTICGHLFCHRCILDSLKWSERQRREDALHPRTVNGLCPVCRKPLKNKEVSATGRTTSGGLVNLEIKKIPRKQYNDDRQREKFLADIEAGKGKQRADTEDVADIENLEPRDDGSEGPSQGSRKRRRVQS